MNPVARPLQHPLHGRSPNPSRGRTTTEPVLPRPIAVEILTRVETQGAFAEPLLDRYLLKETLSERDGRLLTEIVYGTLRMRGYIDWLIGQFCKNGIRALDPPIRNILRTAVYQKFFTERIPDFALVNEAVDLGKAVSRGAGSLVNAILRNILRRYDQMPEPALDRESADFIAIVHSHPLWLVEKWLRLLGPEETAALCEANNRAAPVCVRVNRLRADRGTVIAELADHGFVAEQTLYSGDGLVLAKVPKSLRETACYRSGWIQVQDEASQMIGQLVAPVAGNRVLDLCAGIGGKATHLSEIMGNCGEVVAVDISGDKIAAMKALSARLGTSIIEPRAADALDEPIPGFQEGFDRVLVDAPCSGVGTLRRAPEIKWRLAPRDVGALTDLQKRLLDRAAQYVKPGGRLVYSTCSVLEAENGAVVDDFLASHGAFAQETPGHVPAALLDHRGFFRTYPHRHGCDGFFGAVMVRKEGKS